MFKAKDAGAQVIYFSSRPSSSSRFQRKLSPGQFLCLRWYHLSQKQLERKSPCKLMMSHLIPFVVVVGFRTKKKLGSLIAKQERNSTPVTASGKFHENILTPLSLQVSL